MLGETLMYKVLHRVNFFLGIDDFYASMKIHCELSVGIMERSRTSIVVPMTNLKHSADTGTGRWTPMDQDRMSHFYSQKA